MDFRILSRNFWNSSENERTSSIRLSNDADGGSCHFSISQRVIISLFIGCLYFTICALFVSSGKIQNSRGLEIWIILYDHLSDREYEKEINVQQFNSSEVEEIHFLQAVKNTAQFTWGRTFIFLYVILKIVYSQFRCCPSSSCFPRSETWIRNNVLLVHFVDFFKC